MKELLRSNDMVFLSYVQAVLRDAGVPFVLADSNMSITEGSLGILPSRILVPFDHHAQAERIVRDVKTLPTNDTQRSCAGSSKELLAQETTQDALLDGQLTLRQPKNGPRTAIDALFLAAAIPAQPGVTILEAGAGTGAASLAAAHRVPGVCVTGVEIQPNLHEIAEYNATCNDLPQVRFIHADLTRPLVELEAETGLRRESFDHVAANPPFYRDSDARPSPDDTRARAHILTDEGLEQWVRFLTAMATPKGTLTMIHRPEILPELLHLFSGRFGGLILFPLFPRIGTPAARIILQGRKGSRAPVSILPGMVLHEDGSNDYTRQAEAILRDGDALQLTTPC